MITINNNQLCIFINHPNPCQQRDEIIKAIAAAIRWRASYTENYNGDDYNLYTLSILLAQLSNDV
jgi:predicted metal-dependent RNase